MSYDPEQAFDAILNTQSWSGSGGNRNLDTALQAIDVEFETNGRFGIHKLVIVVAAAGSSSVDASSKVNSVESPHLTNTDLTLLQATAMKSTGITIVLVEIQSSVQSSISSVGSALLASSFSAIASVLSINLRRHVSDLQNCRDEVEYALFNLSSSVLSYRSRWQHHLLTSAEQRPLFVLTKGGSATVVAQQSTCVHSLPASASSTFTLIGIQGEFVNVIDHAANIFRTQLHK